MDVPTALADPTRREILERLGHEDLSAGDLAAGFTVSRPAVSRHLRVLREAGLVTAEQHAQQRVYRLVPQPLEELESWLAEVRRSWTVRVEAAEPPAGTGPEDERGRRARRRSHLRATNRRARRSGEA